MTQKGFLKVFQEIWVSQSLADMGFVMVTQGYSKVALHMFKHHPPKNTQIDPVSSPEHVHMTLNQPDFEQISTILRP